MAIPWKMREDIVHYVFAAELQSLQCLIWGGTAVFVEYCVAPDYPLHCSVAITFSIKKQQNKNTLFKMWTSCGLYSCTLLNCHNSKSVTQFLAVRVLVRSKSWLHDQFCLHNESSQLLKRPRAVTYCGNHEKKVMRAGFFWGKLQVSVCFRILPISLEIQLFRPQSYQ